MKNLHIIIILFFLLYLLYFHKKETFNDLPYNKRYIFSNKIFKFINSLHKDGLIMSSYKPKNTLKGLYDSYIDDKHIYKVDSKTMNSAPPKTSCCNNCIIKHKTHKIYKTRKIYKTGKLLKDNRYGDIGT